MTQVTRTAFFVSDRTGITSEALGNSLLTQFSDIKIKKISLSFINTLDKAKKAVNEINQRAQLDGKPPLIFSTQITKEYRDLLANSEGIFFDFFDTFISKMERALDAESSHKTGLSHGLSSQKNYLGRIDSINFALNNDDGSSIKNYDDADIILIGVSRSGKTPTCLFLALQYGIYAANYPLIEQDLTTDKIPQMLQAHKDKLFALTINPTHLHKIRSERRSNSVYATLSQCQKEVRRAESIFAANGIASIDSSQMSIEEIATLIINKKNLKHLR